MMPLYFGSSRRTLFGIYEPPAAGAGRRGFVVCSTLGREYYFTHRTSRLLAKRLAGAGVHAFRYDHLGTGNSALDLDEARWSDWLGGVEEAVDELRDMAGLRSVGLIGLRLGADLAAEAAAACRADRLVLWDPVVDRSGFLAELGSSELVACFPEGWAAGSPTSWAVPPRTLLACSRSAADPCGPLAADLASRSAQFHHVASEDSDHWWSGEADVGRLPVPTASIQAIVDWCRTS